VNEVMKKLPATTAKPGIKIKENPKAEAIKKAPDEVIAKAIRDVMLKEKEKR
jgi:hypothetical protein